MEYNSGKLDVAAGYQKLAAPAFQLRLTVLKKVCVLLTLYFTVLHDDLLIPK
jgi:hypothetical protein